MKKIILNLENAISEKEIQKYQEKVSKINESMNNFTSEGSDFLGWKDLPENSNWKEIEQMKKSAKILHDKNIETLVVIGIGGSYLGAKAAIDFVHGQYPGKERKMEIVFAGTSISSTSLAQLLNYVKNKKFAINVISKSGTTTEPAIAFRFFKNLLEEKVGAKEANELIFATTDAKRGTLFEFATTKKYQKFVISDDIGGRFSVLSPVGLFPLICAGINVDDLLEGAKEANKIYKDNSLETNDAYKYAVTRFVLGKKYSTEMLVSYEPNFSFFNEWWKQLYGESEGKEGKGLLPTSAVFSTDLHSLGQFIQEGSKILFETVMTVKNPKYDLTITEDVENLDKLNYLANKTVHYVNDAAFKATTDAHVKEGKVPNIHLLLDDFSEKTLGWLIMFFERACAISAYLLEINPFNQPGVEVYKKNMFKILGKN
ncbi:glucose-6-phosphate isomerase [Mesomycoplasma lagogenitalium]|uniref:Glucose-6-phosphate isomerase n=1 Tax=Mesomycoplasma lagogenitalium TaxID=171286 RepID=A0ABY8LVW1_9BACT|nr:glucose-6-phosphate isomerase [Mesomycoplasma lagogenitalium]WGI36673.1 glucose-6-phosphate isomerase [Mesomycoplasma lagogenitalium]